MEVVCRLDINARILLKNYSYDPNFLNCSVVKIYSQSVGVASKLQMHAM